MTGNEKRMSRSKCFGIVKDKLKNGEEVVLCYCSMDCY